ncbi:tail fiber domain-containing protein [Mesorhizobium ventifaucium]|uniref:Peptidase S74 domain-containing protein n=1 Tax=Mesorhizobium ventifaucium TaxID=666020 RepID=A0ABM9EBH7_9HYPH|nr:tail fiber domain-containing protein [Mesorhizobium ventifaucium]CAH2406597.1 Peptidase S74 domain-containing protein [Mesorhizobium ventifaucium]
MKSNLNDQPTPSHLSVESTAAEPNKARYSTPALQIYGSVSAITRGGNGSGLDGGMAGMSMVSDPRAKENVVRIGTHSLGIGLYLFDYKPEYREQWGLGRQFGVMADEVETVMPEAVSVHPDGYKRVDYGMLRIRHPSIH